MIANRIGIVICRVGAILLVAQTFQNISYIIGPSADWGGVRWLLSTGFYMLSPLVAALLLWSFAEHIGKIGAPTQEECTDLHVSASQLVAAGTFLIGIYMLAFGIVSALQIEAQQHWMAGLTPERLTDTVAAQTMSRRVGYIIQILIGIVLMLYTKRKI